MEDDQSPEISRLILLGILLCLPFLTLYSKAGGHPALRFSMHPIKRPFHLLCDLFTCKVVLIIVSYDQICKSIWSKHNVSPDCRLSNHFYYSIGAPKFALSSTTMLNYCGKKKPIICKDFIANGLFIRTRGWQLWFYINLHLGCN